MIGMSVRINEVVDAQAMLGGQYPVAVELAQFRIDQRRGAGLLAAQQVGAAAPGSYSLENHGRLICCAACAIAFALAEMLAIFSANITRLALDELDDGMQHPVGGRRDAQRLATPHDQAVQMIDLTALAARQILRGR